MHQTERIVGDQTAMGSMVKPSVMPHELQWLCVKCILRHTTTALSCPSGVCLLTTTLTVLDLQYLLVNYWLIIMHILRKLFKIGCPIVLLHIVFSLCDSVCKQRIRLRSVLILISYRMSWSLRLDQDIPCHFSTRILKKIFVFIRASYVCVVSCFLFFQSNLGWTDPPLFDQDK